MDYHLYSNGQMAGIFSLEELHRRRLREEVRGTDLVWRQGMVDWQSLDSVLLANGLAVAPATTPPIPAHGSAANQSRSQLPPWVFVLGAAFALAGVIGVTMAIVQGTRRARLAYRLSQGQGAEDSIDIVSKRVSVGTNTQTAADVRKRGRDFRERQYLQAYRKHGPHNQPWDADALKLFDSWLARQYGGETNAGDPKALAMKLAATPGCDDPVVLVIAASNIGEQRQRIDLLQRALKGFEHSPYKAYPKFYATVYLGNESPGRPNLDVIALRYFKEMLEDGGLAPGDETELAESLVHDWGSGFRQRNGNALFPIAQDSKSFKWLGLVLEGEYHVSEAWKSRGGGYANTVNERGWKGFELHSAQAHAAFEKAWKMHPDRVIAPARMIYVAMGEAGAEEMRLWFDRATAAQIDYPAIWSHMRWGLRPRWHGSLEAMLALGVTAVETKRFDTDVPRKIMDIIGDMEQELDIPPGQHIYGRPDIWPHLKQMYDGYVAEPKQAEYRDGWRSSYAMVSFLAGHYDVSRSQLEALHWKPAPFSLTGWGTELSLMPSLVAGYTSAASNQVARAENAYERRNLNVAESNCTALAESDQADQLTRDYAKARLASIKREKLLARGEWIDLLPTDEHDPDWVIWNEKIRRLPDGALEVSADRPGHSLYSRTRVGENFEVKGEVEIINSPSNDFHAGILMGLPDNESSQWYAFQLYRAAEGKPGATFSHHWTTPRRGKWIELDSNRIKFQFKYLNGKADAWVNGEQVLNQLVLSKNMYISADAMLGLGGAGTLEPTVVRYRDVKVRRIDPGKEQPFQ